jgi:hypothetical protein
MARGVLGPGVCFLLKLIEKLLQEARSFGGKSLSRFGLHGVLEAKKLCKKVIDAEAGIVGSAVFAEGIDGVVELGPHVTAKHEAATKADCSEGLDSVGVLENFCLDGTRSNIGREAVGFDGVVDGVEMFSGVVFLA